MNKDRKRPKVGTNYHRPMKIMNWLQEAILQSMRMRMRMIINIS